ncbi:hypothetical protein AVEN_8617-1 [Araneus ventricosus]|uniref:Uncharacterized protein n=1 Tax=Araneus ventricosus TaxID=182803 RepID=A0A4Y2C5X8_ARAVE|nr:hypothetical protein AVEN_8617-1 [Araneus ventricosus]
MRLSGGPQASKEGEKKLTYIAEEIRDFFEVARTFYRRALWPLRMRQHFCTKYISQCKVKWAFRFSNRYYRDTEKQPVFLIPHSHRSSRIAYSLEQQSSTTSTKSTAFNSLRNFHTSSLGTFS